MTMTLLEDDATRKFDGIASHRIAGGGGGSLVTAPDRLREIRVQPCYLHKISETSAMNVEEPP